MPPLLGWYLTLFWIIDNVQNSLIQNTSRIAVVTIYNEIKSLHKHISFILIKVKRNIFMTTGIMEYKLRLPDDIVALIRGLHPILKRRVRSALALICMNPYDGKALKEEMIGLRSFRIKRFRIIYKISSDRTIGLIALGPRKRIYAETYRILKKKQAPSNVKMKM